MASKDFKPHLDGLCNGRIDEILGIVIDNLKFDETNETNLPFNNEKIKYFFLSQTDTGTSAGFKDSFELDHTDLDCKIICSKIMKTKLSTIGYSTFPKFDRIQVIKINKSECLNNVYVTLISNCHVLHSVLFSIETIPNGKEELKRILYPGVRETQVEKLTEDSYQNRTELITETQNPGFTGFNFCGNEQQSDDSKLRSIGSTVSNKKGSDYALKMRTKRFNTRKHVFITSNFKKSLEKFILKQSNRHEQIKKMNDDELYGNKSDGYDDDGDDDLPCSSFRYETRKAEIQQRKEQKLKVGQSTVENSLCFDSQSQSSGSSFNAPLKIACISPLNSLRQPSPSCSQSQSQSQPGPKPKKRTRCLLKGSLNMLNFSIPNGYFGDSSDSESEFTESGKQKKKPKKSKTTL